MTRVRHLEIHVAHSCNLTCESCWHYSNHGHPGLLSLQEAERWMRLWNRRIWLKKLSLLGGEPTLHPELAEFVRLSPRNWPDARLRIVTNGFLLHRHPDLSKVLKNDPKACLYAYRPLAPDCTDEELERYFSLEEEPYCAMCPATREKMKIPVPFGGSPQSRRERREYK